MKKLPQKIKTVLLTAIMAALGMITILPFLWMLSSSFKIASEIFSFPIEWIPRNGTLANYETVWNSVYPFGMYYWNSFYITVITLAGALLVNTMAGYAFARIEFKGRNALFLLYLSALMIPNQVTLIPKFFIFNIAGMLDTHLALILPGIFQVFCVFLMRQFFMQIPFDYTEAAKIDGANEATTFIKIILPMAKPAMITCVILIFTWTWNDYENPLIFLTSKDLYTLTLGLNHFVEEMGTAYGPLMAASLSSIVLIVIIFLAGQRYFVEGLTSGGVKG